MEKTQYIRLADVFLIGPLMIYFSQAKDYSDISKGAMLAFGIGTILYNGYNYLQKEGKI